MSPNRAALCSGDSPCALLTLKQYFWWRTRSSEKRTKPRYTLTTIRPVKRLTLRNQWTDAYQATTTQHEAIPPVRQQIASSGSEHLIVWLSVVCTTGKCIETLSSCVRLFLSFLLRSDVRTATYRLSLVDLWPTAIVMAVRKKKQHKNRCVSKSTTMLDIHTGSVKDLCFMMFGKTGGVRVEVRFLFLVRPKGMLWGIELNAGQKTDSQCIVLYVWICLVRGSHRPWLFCLLSHLFFI